MSVLFRVIGYWFGLALGLLMPTVLFLLSFTHLGDAPASRTLSPVTCRPKRVNQSVLEVSSKAASLASASGRSRVRPLAGLTVRSTRRHVGPITFSVA